jgi:hypothetical protein
MRLKARRVVTSDGLNWVRLREREIVVSDVAFGINYRIPFSLLSTISPASSVSAQPISIAFRFDSVKSCKMKFQNKNGRIGLNRTRR